MSKAIKKCARCGDELTDRERRATGQTGGTCAFCYSRTWRASDRKSQTVKVGDQVTVDDGERRPFTGTVVGPSDTNSAEILVDAGGKCLWSAHWAYVTKGAHR